jgi:hypothetical protein
MPAPSALELLWAEIKVFWWTWDLEIAFGIVYVGAVYFLIRWMLRRFPDFFYERDLCRSF